MLRRLRFRLLVAMSAVVLIGLLATALIYLRQAEAAILAEHQRALHKVTDAVGSSLESIMEGGHAEVAAEFTRRLAGVEGASRFLIVRTDGTPAFQDNATIGRVNARLGYTAFAVHEDRPAPAPIPEAARDEFAAVVAGREAVNITTVQGDGERFSLFLDPIFARPMCVECHDDGQAVRGVVVLETSFRAVERDMSEARVQALFGLAIAMAVTMLLTGYLLGHMLFRPIEGVTRAMRRVATGDWDHGIAVDSKDEIGQMASSFNLMRVRLKANYLSLLAEQDKLTTILLTSREGVVVTDREGGVVLVNPAAEEILGKSTAEIRDEGFERIIDQPGMIHSLLIGEQEASRIRVLYRGRMLAVGASMICEGDGSVIGSAALIRDIDEEHRLREQLSSMARTDELTGLFNRRHLDQRFAEEFDRMRVCGRPLAVLIFDVDHFKRFNDEHGHEAGDRVLRGVSRRSRETLRCYDVLGRYGGEEFVAVLPGLHSGDATPVADRLRRDIELLEVEGLRVTISIGIACTESVAAESPAELLAAADAALYQAKAAGRNRIEIALSA
ncbi:MAG: diguanylate cyclase [Rhodocyclaceae bacterium]|nr:diguanylate cyclase [Rhodocyclaceae bacterium]